MLSINVALIGFLSLLQASTLHGEPRKIKTLVVSLDGFSLHYIKSGTFYLPWLNKIRKHGVFTESMQSVFPGETFCNHYSMVTGLHPESHGIVSNIFYDPELNETFSSRYYKHSGNENYVSTKFWRKEPIWKTARRLNIARTATSMWPGELVSEYHASKYRTDFSSKVKFVDRIDQMVRWFQNDDIDVGFLFSFEPDDTGHHTGTDSAQTRNAIEATDRAMGYLLKRLSDAGYTAKNFNLLIVSDHGMWNVERDIALEDLLPPGAVESWFDQISRFGALLSMWPKKDKSEDVYSYLQNASQSMKLKGAFTVYRKCEMPEKLHYCKSPRIPPLIALCSPGNYLAPKRFSAKAINYRANHGSDIVHIGMRPIFIAQGPAFKSGGYNATLKTTEMQTKDIYSIVARLIGLTSRRGAPQVEASYQNVAGLFA